jgi:transcriptional regulator with XRE-family HTH domain
MEQDQAAAAVGKTGPGGRVTISRWENGKARIPFDAAMSLARLYKTSLEALGFPDAIVTDQNHDIGSEKVSRETTRSARDDSAERELPRQLRIMALDFEKEALQAGADENFIRFARQALRNPELVAMFEGGYDAKPMSAEEQRIEMQAHIDGLRGILKTRMDRLKEATRR